MYTWHTDKPSTSSPLFAMLTLQRLCVAFFLLLLNYNAVRAFTISVPSLEVAIGHKFGVSWTSTSNDPQAVDICLNTADATQFIPVGSIQRANASSGTVDIVIDDSILPSTYTLGIRFPGCSFLLAAEFDDFVVVQPACAPPS
ncbi:hypothetical protein B0H34DRAFT_795488 [Crassisporium funariophilum]|nr:hypothetical protein B0H34DRAFT_795488 [Crassisporium funariophilum]